MNNNNNIRFIVFFILYFANTNVLSSVITTSNNDWQVIKQWEKLNSSYFFQTQSKNIIKHCEKNADHYLIFPSIVQATHRILLDDTVIHSHGSSDFQYIKSYFGSPIVPCKNILIGKIVTWEVHSLVKKFSRINQLPYLSSTIPIDNLVQETFNIVAAGSLIILAFFCAIIFIGKINIQLCISLSLSCLFFAIYFISTTSSYFGITASMIFLHKTGDVCLAIGACFLLNCLKLSRLLNEKLFLIYLVLVSVSCLTIIFADNLSVAQFGTSLMFIPTLLLFSYTLLKEINILINKGFNQYSLLLVLSYGVFVFTAFNDILYVEGLINSYMFFSVGIVSAVFFFALSVNINIIDTYKERDYLRANLEREVKRKTAELEQTMNNLKSTQAELIQSARLAALGTLAAGIAHEIKNSLNYVNGVVGPFTRLAVKLSDEKDRAKADKLIFIIKEGLKLTFDIIQSLTNYTGLNQAKRSEANIKELIDSILILLKHRLHHKIKVKVDVAENLVWFVDIVSINQILMNLIGNAVDALDQGTITIKAEIKDNNLVLSVNDTGSGIEESVLEHIFDPFFTTKDVGKGTGLGLYIVSKEVARHNGTISIDSVIKQGTTLTLQLPGENTQINTSTRWQD